MARDFDFRRKPSGNESSHHTGTTVGKISQPLQPQKHLNQHGAAPAMRRSRQARSQSLLWLTIIGLAAAGIGTYYWSTLPPKTTVRETAQTQKEAITSTTPQSNETNVFTKNDKPIIQIYEGGAPASVVEEAMSLLKEKGYEVENLGRAQFEYDKTYIWYTKEYVEEAQTIGQLLTGRVVSYRESQSAGVFDVLIYLGKQ